MLLWRLSGLQHAEAFDGGYGLLYDGRWNTVGHAVTYCATSPSLCVLEKLVHVQDPALLPELVLCDTTYLTVSAATRSPSRTCPTVGGATKAGHSSEADDRIAH